MLALLAMLLPAAALGAPLLPRAPGGPAAPPVSVAVAPLSVTLAPGPECALELVQPFTVLAGGWVELPVVGPGLVLGRATLDGRPVRLAGHAAGLALIARLPAGIHELRLSGTAACADSQLRLATPLGGPLRLETTGPDQSWTVADGVHTGPRAWDLPPTAALSVAWAPPRDPPPRPRVLRHDNVVGLRVEDGGIEGRALLRHTVVHGSQDALVVDVPGGVDEVEATGPLVAGVTHQGGRVTVALREAVTGTVEVELRWRSPAPGAEGAPAPVPVPVAGRGETAVVVVRGDDAVLLPVPGPGLEAVPLRRVPRRGRGLVPGEPLVSYVAGPGQTPALHLSQRRFSPVDQPPTVIDDARYTVMYAGHGRAWMRATWQVRNDRNPFLRVTVPPGWRVFGLRVAGTTAEPVRDADGTLLVPLEKSVETLDGLVAFPVELMLVGEDAAWSPRGLRALATPAVDAPIAMARWELRLPHAVRPREVSGRAQVVSTWTPDTQGLLIGRAAKLPPPATSMSSGEQLSQEYWNQAYTAYKSNDFDAADDLLQKSLSVDPTNSAAQSLLGNIDVLKNRAQLDDDEQLAANRVRALAKARSGDTVLAQAEKEAELERALRSGDDEAAARVADELLVIGSQLAAVEQQEAVEQKARLSSYRSTADALSRDKDRRDAPAAKGKKKVAAKEARGEAAPVDRLARLSVPPPEAAAPVSSGGESAQDGQGPATGAAGDFFFDDIDVEGELVAPEGALLLDRRKAEFSPLIRTPDLAEKIGDTSVVDGDAGQADPAPPPPPPPPAPAPESLDASLAWSSDEAAGFGGGGWAESVGGTGTMGTVEGGVAGGVVGGVVGGAKGAAVSGVAFGAAAPAEAPAPASVAEERAEVERTVQETVLLEAIVVEEANSRRPQAVEARPGAGREMLEEDVMMSIPTGRSYQQAIELVPVEGRRRLGRGMAPRDRSRRGPAAPAPAPAFPAAPSPDPAFPAASSPDPAFPPAVAGAPAPAFPVVPPVPPSHPVAPLVPSPSHPRAAGAPAPAFPAAPAAAPALPRRPAPPPAAPFGLDIPETVVASTLSLSLPEGGARLLLEQRVIPPDEPLRIDLRYRPARTPTP